MYKTKVLEIGDLVKDFEPEQMMVLFGITATPELKEMSVVHDGENNDKSPLRVGGDLTLGNKKYKIIKVGNEANKNLDDLGHIAIYFRDEEQILPGAIEVEPYEFPQLSVGDEIIID